MASSIVEFKNEALNVTINTIKVGDTIYFKGKDVATVLGYSDPDKAIRTHVDTDYKCLLSDLVLEVAPPAKSAGGLTFSEKQTIYITEPGMYQLIFKSKKAEAKLFTKWVVEEVLPSIRKTGTYKLKMLNDMDCEPYGFEPSLNW